MAASGDTVQSDVAFTVSSVKAFYIPGEPVLLQLAVTNSDKEDMTLTMKRPVENAVNVTLEEQEGLSVRRIAIESQSGLFAPVKFVATPGETARVCVILDTWYILEKPGTYKGKLAVEIKDHADLTAPFEVIVIDPLERVAAEYYDTWSKTKQAPDKRFAAECLSHVRSNYAIKYLELIALNEEAPDGDRELACSGLVRIETRESALSLVKLAESEKLPEKISYYCRALTVEWHKRTTNDEIKQATKGIAEKYPDAVIPKTYD